VSRAGNCQQLEFSSRKVDDESFLVLGGNVSEDYGAYNEYMMNRTSAFFDALKELEVHPQLKFTILRLCGAPRLRYHCSVHEPRHSQQVAEHFQHRIVEAITDIVGSRPTDQLLHDTLGAGMPNYVAKSTELYRASLAMYKMNTVRPTEVGLVTTELDSAPFRAQHKADYLFYKGGSAQLTPAQFVLALGIRLRCLPLHLKGTPRSCGCGTTCTTETECIEHAIHCEKFSQFSKTTRHNMIRDALVRVANSYGIWCTTEPRIFVYDSVERQRPDIIFHTTKPIVTDVSVVSTVSDVGVAAAVAAKDKIKTHKTAVERTGYTFIPFTLETYGHCDESCTQLITAIANQIPRHMQWHFKGDMMHGVSTALAVARCQAVQLALSRDFGIFDGQQ
jgi:hypothetical protein